MCDIAGGFGTTPSCRSKHAYVWQMLNEVFKQLQHWSSIFLLEALLRFQYWHDPKILGWRWSKYWDHLNSHRNYFKINYIRYFLFRIRSMPTLYREQPGTEFISKYRMIKYFWFKFSGTRFLLKWLGCSLKTSRFGFFSLDFVFIPFFLLRLGLNVVRYHIIFGKVSYYIW